MPKEDAVFSSLNYFKFWFCQNKKHAKCITFNNLEVFTVEKSWPDWGSMAIFWAVWVAGQVISLYLMANWFYLYLGLKGCVDRTHDLLALHCGSHLRPQLISKWSNIVSKQTIPSGKFHHPVPSSQLQFSSLDHSRKMWEYFPIKTH